MSITVPVQAPGAKSLPAQMRLNPGANALARLRAQHPGYPMGMPRGPRVAMMRMGMRGLRGLGDDDTGGIDLSTLPDVGSGTTYVPPINTTIYTPVDVPVIDPGLQATLDAQTQAALSQMGNDFPPPSAYSGPTVVGPNSATPAAPAGYQWATLLNSTGQTLAKVLAISQGGSTVTLPNGTQIMYGSPASAAAGAAGNILTSGTVAGVPLSTILVIGGGLLLLMMVTGGGGGGRR